MWQVMVFSWSVCPFAQRAQRILRESGAKFEAIELDKVPDGKALKAELGMLTGTPNITGTETLPPFLQLLVLMHRGIQASFRSPERFT